MRQWVNTKVVIDLDSGVVLEKRGYVYAGPWALATNVAWGFVVSSEAFYTNYTVITTATPTKEGIDLFSGGYGAALRHDGMTAATPTWPMIPPMGWLGTRVHTDGSLVGQYYAPVAWTDAQDGFDNTVPVEPSAPTRPPWSLMLRGIG